jgi:ABC-type transport system substrate-binding protein
LNASRPLFANARLRKAVNYAIDRQALARLGFETTPSPAVPTDQFLIPGARGFRDADIYPFRPNVAKARQLAGREHPTAVFYSCDNVNCREHAAIIKKNLAAIGLKLKVEEFPLGPLLTKLHTRGEPFDLAIDRRFVGSPDPFLFLNPLLDPSLGANAGHFADPLWVQKLRAAAKMSGARRDAAYGRLDVDLARAAAPLAAFSYQTRQDFFSARVGCQIYNPAYGIDLAALCIKQ